MAISNVDLYEALKGPVGEKAARMIADVFPPARNLATNDGLTRVEGNLEARIFQVEAKLEAKISQLELKVLELRAEMIDRIAMSESRIMGRLWVMFVPLWIGVFGLIATLIVKG